MYVHADVRTFGRAAEAAGFRLDEAQIVAATRLAAAANAVAAGERVQSLYLWGPVGRGKSWLVDVLVGVLPDGWVRRFHFHAFFREFHEGLRRHGPGHHAVARALDDVIGDARLMCIDELYAHEPGDAQLFTIILRELRERRDFPMIVTSNYAPDDLMPDAEFVTTGLGAWDPVKVRHSSFEAGIAVIKRTFEVINIDGGVDYRAAGSVPAEDGFSSGLYIVREHQRPDAWEPVAVRVYDGREVTAELVEHEAVTFSFQELCEQPVSAGDITRLVRRFRSWTLVGVPPLASCSPEAAQRFVNLVDVLCDADVRLNVWSHVAPMELVAGAVPPDLARARSRLGLLQLRHAPS